MAQRRLRQIDESTGEILPGGFVAYVAPKRRNAFTAGWVAMAQDAATLIAQSDLEGQDLKVLFGLIGRLDFENLLVLNQAELAREIKMHRQHVNRSVRRLVHMGILLQGPRIGVSRSYRLNPRFGWKGSAQTHQKAMQERKQAAGITHIIEGGKGRTGPEDEAEDVYTVDIFTGKTRGE